MINDSIGSPPLSPAPVVAPFLRHAGWLSIAAGGLFLVAQTVMWTFDQRLNLESSQDPVFILAKIIYLAGFIVLMFALIAVYGLQAPMAGRLGVAAFALAIVGTMMLAGDLWFETVAGRGTRKGGPDCSAIRHHGAGRHLELCPLCRRMDPVRDRQRAGPSVSAPYFDRHHPRRDRRI